MAPSPFTPLFILLALLAPSYALAQAHPNCEPITSSIKLPAPITPDEIQCIAQHDLNQDGENEWLLFYGTPYCGSAGCKMEIYKAGDSWKLLLSTYTMIDEMIFLDDTTTHGYQDISIGLKVPCDESHDCRKLGNIKQYVLAYSPKVQTYALPEQGMPHSY